MLLRMTIFSPLLENMDTKSEFLDTLTISSHVNFCLERNIPTTCNPDSVAVIHE